MAELYRVNSLSFEVREWRTKIHRIARAACSAMSVLPAKLACTHAQDLPATRKVWQNSPLRRCPLPTRSRTTAKSSPRRVRISCLLLLLFLFISLRLTVGGANAALEVRGR